MLNRLTGRWAMTKMQEYFLAWSELTKNMNKRRQKLISSLQRWSSRVMKQVFYGWKHVTYGERTLTGKQRLKSLVEKEIVNQKTEKRLEDEIETYKENIATFQKEYYEHRIQMEKVLDELESCT